MVTIRANYAGEPDYLLGTAPVYDLDVQVEGETARLAFIVPPLNIPIAIPIQVRTGSDYGLRMTVAGITQLIPLASAKMTVWGFPAETKNDDRTLPAGLAGQPGGLPGLRDRALRLEQRPGAAPTRTSSSSPFTDNPSVCTGAAADRLARRPTYQDPTQVSHAEDQYPPTTGCEQQTFKPVLNVGSDHEARPTRPPGSTSAEGRPAAEQGADAVEHPLGDRRSCPRAVSINPDAADGQTACTDAQAELRQRGAGALPGQLEDRHLRHRHAGARRPADRLALHRRAEARQPVPALHGRSRLRDQREARRRRPARTRRPAS